MVPTDYKLVIYNKQVENIIYQCAKILPLKDGPEKPTGMGSKETRPGKAHFSSISSLSRPMLLETLTLLSFLPYILLSL